MILNTHPYNKCTAYDLTDTELERFYKGVGNVSILIDAENNIIHATYQDDAVEGYNSAYRAEKDHKILKGIFSCCQFCVM